MDSEGKRPGQPERRRHDRSALRLNATMRIPGRSRSTVRMIDISTHGCRIESPCGAGVDSWTWLSIAGLETQYCRIVWRCQEFMGLQFATPLAPAVLENLLRSQERLSETSIGELRDIARRTHRLATSSRDGESEILAEMSRRCALDAVVEGLRNADSSVR